MSVIKNGRVLNWKRDLPNKDLLYSDKYPKAPSYPSVMDLRGSCPPIVDQGQFGSCTGNALAGALGYLEIIKDPEFEFSTFESFSRMFIYWNERSLEGDIGTDGGAMLRDGIQILKDLGVCRESTWPYSQPDLLTKPSEEAFGQAQAHRITNALRLNNTKISQLKSCLVQRFPFVFGVTVYDSIFSVGSDGMVPMPRDSDAVAGGHALCCVGFSDSKRVFIVRNSWGTGWGDKGYCYFPYDYLTDENLASDFWALEH